MNQNETIYASRFLAHKNPFGAVHAGEPVTFTLTPPRDLCFTRVFLSVKDEFGGHNLELPLRWVGLDGNRDKYTVTLETENLLGPIFYWFFYETAKKIENRSQRGGTFVTGFLHAPQNLPNGEAVRDEFTVPPPGFTPTPFQLTVTAARPRTAPDWYGKGLTYHIFPDRFCRSKIPDPAGIVGDRVVHENWRDCPNFRPDANGEVRNRDFFGGDLVGVRSKLPYLADLGVSTIYFSPIFEAASNHRYDTADYRKIDPFLGTEADFTALCAAAAQHGIRVILDGVFNHTGYDSVYFNGRGFYPEPGAMQSPDSPYFKWYNFSQWPHKYSSWWGIYTLPDINENDPSYRNFIYADKDAVVRHWIRAGAAGWRLDVADELPDDFIAGLAAAAKEEKPDAVVIGEVWEDASNKIAYDIRRRYLLGTELDSVMNYPFRNELIRLMLEGDAAQFRDEMELLREHYPADITHDLMNALGTHDTPRILTVLGMDKADWDGDKASRAEKVLSDAQRGLAVRRLKLASMVLYAFPGSPCVFYGDEVGLEGFEDPFNRRGYPWGEEDTDLLAHYRKLGAARKQSPALQSGDIGYLIAEDDVLCFARYCGEDCVLLCINRGDTPQTVSLPFNGDRTDLLTGRTFNAENGVLTVTLDAVDGVLLG